MSGTTVQGIPLLVYGTDRKAYGGSYRMFFARWYQEGESQHSPRSPKGSQVRPKVLVAQHT